VSPSRPLSFIEFERRAASSEAEDRVTEAGAAERFARLHGDDVRFSHRTGRWLLWQSHRWAPDADEGVIRLALEFARAWQREAVDIPERDRREAAIKATLRLERRDALDSMLKLARGLRPIADSGDWDTDPWLLGTPNGTVELATGALRPGRREDRITLGTSVAYDPEARSDLWEETLRAVLPADGLVDFLQVAIGYSATGDTRRDVWFLAHGSGRNGKGTVMHPIRRALGGYAVELPAAIFDRQRDAAPYDLASLPGKRLVMCSEAGDTIRLHHDRIKQISGGDPIRAANKYERSFEFEPVCKLWLAANRKPRVTDDSPAFWARVLTIPFAVSFVGRENRSLRPTLEHEPEHQAAVLAWIVRGAVRYATEGLTPPEAITAATGAYEQESDPLSEFFAEAIDFDPPARIQASELFDHYKTWAHGHGMTERERLGSRTFGQRIAAEFKSHRVNGVRFYFGLSRRLQ
jgi:putative DNA primase/helicase